MSRTRKGGKASGWEYWGTGKKHQEPAPDYEREYMFITPQEVLMSREVEYPLTSELKQNLDKLLIALNQFRAYYGKPMVVTSGYRPGKYNAEAKGAAMSNHQVCLACDFKDTDGELDKFCMEHPEVLEKCGLYLEHPDSTPGWAHLQAKAPKSGKRVFRP